MKISFFLFDLWGTFMPETSAPKAADNPFRAAESDLFFNCIRKVFSPQSRITLRKAESNLCMCLKPYQKSIFAAKPDYPTQSETGWCYFMWEKHILWNAGLPFTLQNPVVFFLRKQKKQIRKTSAQKTSECRLRVLISEWKYTAVKSARKSRKLQFR